MTRVKTLLGGAMLPIRGKQLVDAHMHLLGTMLLRTTCPLEHTLPRQVPSVPICRPRLVLSLLNLLDLTTCGTGLHGNSWLRHLLPPHMLKCMLPWSSLWPTLFCSPISLLVNRWVDCLATVIFRSIDMYVECPRLTTSNLL